MNCFFSNRILTNQNNFAETDLQDQVEGSLNMGPTYETVVARAQLALVSTPSIIS